MQWPQFLLSLLIIGLCGVLLLVILLQRGKGGGLAGAFGGGGGGGGAFGAKTGDVLTWATVILALLFLLVIIVANFAFDLTAKPPSAAPAVTISPDSDGEQSLPDITTTTPDGVTAVPVELLDIDAVPVPAPTGANEPASAGGTDQPGGTPSAEPDAGKDGATTDDKGLEKAAGDGSSAPSDKPTNSGGG